MKEALVTKPDKANTHRLSGRCFCGAVHYEVADEFVYALNCHCSNCQRATASAFKPFAGIERDKLRLTAGDDRLLVFGDLGGAHDKHCGQCGSLLYSVVREGAYVHVTMGTLVDTPSIRPTAHIFVGSKAKWFTVTDDLPQYDEHIPG
ncbi:MAG: GFA family protein [Mesorhizobium sp.]|nr:MAG: GFA family protein [Mesorhizobium sp.]